MPSTIFAYRTLDFEKYPIARMLAKPPGRLNAKSMKPPPHSFPEISASSWKLHWIGRECRPSFSNVSTHSFIPSIAAWAVEKDFPFIGLLAFYVALSNFAIDIDSQFSQLLVVRFRSKVPSGFSCKRYFVVPVFVCIATMPLSLKYRCSFIPC